MKARKIKGLDPAGPLDANARRIVAVRATEVLELAERAQDPREVEALHDLRIAAKRVRYLLELVGPTCMGRDADTLIKDVKGLQDLLGEIHDCDVQLPRVNARLEELRSADARQARARASAKAADLDPRLATRTAHTTAWRGLETLAVYLEARRGLLFERFLQLWTQLERDGFRARLDYAVRERPEALTPGSQDGNADAAGTRLGSRAPAGLA